MNNVELFIQNRIKQIQKKYNFNPNYGKRQIKNSPEANLDFYIFKEYIKIIRKCNLEISIPYDPFGLKNKTSTNLIKNDSCVYFARLISDASIWKIGFSIAPYKRGKVLQVGNHEALRVVDVIKGGDRNLESAILKYTIKYATSGGTEWRKLDKSIIDTIVKTIRKDGPIFLYNKSL